MSSPHAREMARAIRCLLTTFGEPGYYANKELCSDTLLRYDHAIVYQVEAISFVSFHLYLLDLHLELYQLNALTMIRDC